MIEKYGFMDESGSPGVATHKKDYLVVCLVILESQKIKDNIDKKIDALRRGLSLTDDYEFHFSNNSPISKRAFINLIKTLQFQFIAVAIKKTDFKKDASYTNLANILFSKIEDKYQHLFIEMDDNPILHKELSIIKKSHKATGIYFRQKKSKNHNLIQLADYVTAIYSRKLRMGSRAESDFAAIAKKCIDSNIK